MNLLLSQLQRRAKSDPHSPVLIGTQHSYCAMQLLAAVERVVAALEASNVEVVGLCAENSPEWAIVDLACQTLNLCLVPLPTFFSAQQVVHTVNTAGIELLLYDAVGATQLINISGAIEQPTLSGYGVVRCQPASRAPRPLGTNKVTFTSGSTGEPKGACLSTAQCLKVAQSLTAIIALDRPRHLCVLPLSTLLENIAGLYMPLLSNGCVVIPSPLELGMGGSSKIDTDKFLQMIESIQPQTLILVPALLSVLDAALRQGWEPPARLAFVAVGGARVAPELLKRVSRAGIPVYEGYGLSECASVVSLNAPGAMQLGSAGKVLPHVDAVVRDGEIIVTGNPFLGYLGMAESWAVQEIATGDLGDISEDGFVQVRGRKSNVLISSFGRNISPEWLESEILASGYFTEALVMGEGRPFCIALLLTADSKVTETGVSQQIQTLNTHLPDYAQIGAWWCLNEPLASVRGLVTSNGRPRRDKIAKHFTAQIEQLYSQSLETNPV